MSLPVRADIDLISGRAMRSATRLSILFGEETSALLGSGAGTAVATVTCSASTVAAATCSCIVLVLELAAAPALSGWASELAAALSGGCDAATLARGISGGIGTACFAMRACAAGFDLSPPTPVARRTTAFADRCGSCLGPGCPDMDNVWRDQAM